MSSAAVLGMVRGELATGRPYAERDEREAPWHDRLGIGLWHRVCVPVADRSRIRLLFARQFARSVNALAAETAALDDAALVTLARDLRVRMRREGLARRHVARAFALSREAAQRVLGIRHYDTQVITGWWLLNGALVEMATGEGKTFAASLPAIAAALAGLPVHVVTVNDYLAERDARSLAPLYRFLGLSVSSVVNGQARPERRQAYACDITYVSNKELAFDYLRDRAALGDRASPLHLAVERLRGREARAEGVVMRGLVFGIVDEADSVFIDEARTPLILSATASGGSALDGARAALTLADALQKDVHFEVDSAHRRVRLLDAGRTVLEAGEAAGASGAFESSRNLTEWVERALAARHLYARDQHYVVVDGKVQIVDESTGRAMPDRAWERGLHQIIELKESLEPTGARETLARITYQRLFRRYLRLSGMSGTATEVAAEIGTTYGLDVVRVPTHRPTRRLRMGGTCCLEEADKWRAVVDAIDRIAVGDGRPVLVGTRTVRASETLSALLGERNIEHVVLNAKQDQDESAIVARAGERGRVTVATNMAGRGTDIALGEGVAEIGGLHVILTEYHESPRIDRQLVGRCARQGDRGSDQAIIALTDELFATHAPSLTRLLADWCAGRAHVPWLVAVVLRGVAQRFAEARHRDARAATLRQDRRFARLLAFAGRGE